MELFQLIVPALDTLGKAPAELQIIDVDVLVERYYPSVNTDRPALIGPLVDAAQCQALGARLRQAYPGDHEARMVAGAGGKDPETRTMTLNQLGEATPGPSPVLLYVPPLPCPGAVETFQDTVAHLRAPDGCPWDRKQTHRSLRQGFQEETYEVLDALDRGDLEALQEELGDVLLHVLLQAQIATESGEFRLSDVVCHVNSKIVHRHPHVFDGLEVDGVAQVLVNWETLKQQEKQARVENASAVDGISPAMPALARAQSIQRHVDRTGAVSAKVDDLAARIVERVYSLSAGPEPASSAVIVGELLFDLTNLARRLGVDAESALREENTRFEQQFRAAEQVQGNG